MVITAPCLTDPVQTAHRPALNQEKIFGTSQKIFSAPSQGSYEQRKTGYTHYLSTGFQFFKAFQHSLWTEKYEQNLDISKVSMLKPGLLLFYVSKDK